jgi:hypothetical protein
VRLGVSAQVGHANPELTLRVYTHALREEETDLSSLDFGGTKRHPRDMTKKKKQSTQRPPRLARCNDHLAPWSEASAKRQERVLLLHVLRGT